MEETPDRPEPKSADPLIGRVLSSFRLVERVGRGTFARVYRAEHTFLGRQVAIKVLHDAVASRPTLRERFRREAIASGKIVHQNVMAALDFGETDDGLAYLILEWIPGVTLSSEIKTVTPFPPERAAHIARQIAAGLAEAHRHQLVHRDLKPSNVMLTNEGGGGADRVKILDFGLVRALGAEELVQITRAGQVLGTPRYMAPEVVRGQEATFSSDLYSLGVIMFEMLEGEPPFVAKSLEDVMRKHVLEPVPEIRPAAGLERVVSGLLEKDPAARLGGAQAIVEAIDALELPEWGGGEGATVVRTEIASSRSPRSSRGSRPPRSSRPPPARLEGAAEALSGPAGGYSDSVDTDRERSSPAVPTQDYPRGGATAPDPVSSRPDAGSLRPEVEPRPDTDPRPNVEPQPDTQPRAAVEPRQDSVAPEVESGPLTLTPTQPITARLEQGTTPLAASAPPPRPRAGRAKVLTAAGAAMLIAAAAVAMLATAEREEDLAVEEEHASEPVVAVSRPAGARDEAKALIEVAGEEPARGGEAAAVAREPTSKQSAIREPGSRQSASGESARDRAPAATKDDGSGPDGDERRRDRGGAKAKRRESADPGPTLDSLEADLAAALEGRGLLSRELGELDETSDLARRVENTRRSGDADEKRAAVAALLARVQTARPTHALIKRRLARINALLSEQPAAIAPELLPKFETRYFDLASALRPEMAEGPLLEVARRTASLERDIQRARRAR